PSPWRPSPPEDSPLDRGGRRTAYSSPVMYTICTAGHVDHGKSTLVHALTDMEPDRLAEERARALTIDLGFAWTDLDVGGETATVFFLDLPGHERFITNMLAGAVSSGRIALFVVAA